ncbi:MAG: efflux RND transporter periplasmic adaptor subunit [Gammaproteobacteria bacterium]|nr:efflux RND transporter periplasmic adaptor subunit [Gammaproteobacteria bacterium]
MTASVKKWIIIVPVLLGISAMVVLKQNKVPPKQQPPQELASLARVIAVPSVDISPLAIGYGSVVPSQTWEAVAQVNGKILERNPALEKGAIMEAGSLVLRIDPTDYQLAIARIEADIQVTKAQLDELDAKTVNTRAALEIEQSAYLLNEKELQRKHRLIEQGGVSRSDLESQERALLAQKQSVQTQQNTLNLLPSQRAILQAELKRHQSNLISARRDLNQTEIRLPFTGRISKVNVELDRYVREGDLLVTADGLAMAEVEVQIPIEQMGALIKSNKIINILDTAASSERDFGITANVVLKEGAISGIWEGRVARLSDTLDPKTRTVGVIVEVDNPYAGVQPGIRPPLLKGLFVEVRLRGKQRPDSLIIPRSALRDSQAFVINEENRLETRQLKIELVQPDYVVVRSGLKASEKLLISDIVPAIEGMLVNPQEDSRSLQRLLEQAGRGLSTPSI